MQKALKYIIQDLLAAWAENEMWTLRLGILCQLAIFAIYE